MLPCFVLNRSHRFNHVSRMSTPKPTPPHSSAPQPCPTHVQVVSERLGSVLEVLGLAGAVLPLQHAPGVAHAPHVTERTVHASERHSM